MSKTINASLLFSSILLNQLMTSDVSFHWFKRVVFLSLLFILSRMDLLYLLISFFAGLISLVFGLSVKFGLWSFRDIKHLSWLFPRILFAIVLFFTMFFPCKFICFTIFLFTFFVCGCDWVFQEFFVLFFFRSLYRFVVLSVNVSVLLSLLISCMSSFSFLLEFALYLSKF